VAGCAESRQAVVGKTQVSHSRHLFWRCCPAGRGAGSRRRNRALTVVRPVGAWVQAQDVAMLSTRRSPFPPGRCRHSGGVSGEEWGGPGRGPLSVTDTTRCRSVCSISTRTVPLGRPDAVCSSAFVTSSETTATTSSASTNSTQLGLTWVTWDAHSRAALTCWGSEPSRMPDLVGVPHIRRGSAGSRVHCIRLTSGFVTCPGGAYAPVAEVSQYGR